MIKKFLIISFIIFIALFFSIIYYIFSLFQPVNINDDIKREFIIKKGDSLISISKKLEKDRFIKNYLVFRFYTEYYSLDKSLKASKYFLSSNMTIDEILQKLIKGGIEESKGILFTIPEGDRISDIAQIFKKYIKPSKFILSCSDKNAEIYLKKYGIKFNSNYPSLEGFLFPDSYYFNENVTINDIIEKCIDNFFKHLPNNYQLKCKKLKMSFYDIIILASIIEKEAALKSDMPKISSVFHNRIKKNMLLESCATVQYALNKRKKRLTYKDIKINSPFNTYINKYLPPTPIGNPGINAINAALEPLKTNYYYFVAKGDGSHYFSKTLKEHNRAKKRYLKK